MTAPRSRRILPSLTFRLGPARLELPEPLFLRQGAPVRQAAATKATPATVAARVDWHHATSVGLPYAGHLDRRHAASGRGAGLGHLEPGHRQRPEPAATGSTATSTRSARSSPSSRAYRTAHPHAPELVVGDISFRNGGTMDEHASHQNGLDVDIYYPRLDRHLSAPIATSQIDHHLAQDLLDRFVAAGAQMIFVGYSAGLHGPSDVVIPYPNHENHMHVRFPHPA